MSSANKTSTFLPVLTAEIDSYLNGTRSSMHVTTRFAWLVYRRELAEPDTIIVCLPYLIHSV